MPASSIVDRGIVREFSLDGAELVLATWSAADSRSLMSHAAGLALGITAEQVTIGNCCAHCGSAEHGQPFAQAHGSCGVSFSRAGEYAIAAAHRDARVGVDIESVISLGSHRVDDVLLSAAERESAGDFGPRERDRYLTRLWVAKEAVTKLVGLGLRIELSSLDIRLDGTGGELASRPEKLGLATSPRLTLFDVGEDIVGALAVVD